MFVKDFSANNNFPAGILNDKNFLRNVSLCEEYILQCLHDPNSVYLNCIITLQFKVKPLYNNSFTITATLRFISLI